MERAKRREVQPMCPVRVTYAWSHSGGNSKISFSGRPWIFEWRVRAPGSFDVGRIARNVLVEGQGIGGSCSRAELADVVRGYADGIK
jgi:hypothetical protein